jgi:tRNA 5-methylaminomethyl-2-thiouridine biosynthesis bifunctional protein
MGMIQPIETAQLTRTSHGIAQSQRFDDVYHSPQGGVEQAHHVFLEGNGLPTRWQGQDHFSIGKTGFNLGLKFLVTWAAWRQDPRRSSTLHVVSCELYPLILSDLAATHERLLAPQPVLYSLAQTLQTHWPALSAGTHTLNLDEGDVQLTLIWFQVPRVHKHF